MNIQEPPVLTTAEINYEICMQQEHIRLSEVFFINIHDKLSSAAPVLTGSQLI